MIMWGEVDQGSGSQQQPLSVPGLPLNGLRLVHPGRQELALAG